MAIVLGIAADWQILWADWQILWVTIDQQHWGRSPVAAAPNAGSHYGQQLGGGGCHGESGSAASTDKSRIELGEDQLRVLEGSCQLTPVLDWGPRRVFCILCG